MAAGHILTLGYGVGGTPSLVVTLGYSIAAFEVPTAGSLEWSLPESRLHWSIEDTPLHWSLPESRMHWRAEK